MNARGLWVAFVTLITREVLRFARIWIQTLLPPMVTTALYFVIFGRLIGEQLGPMDGIAYVDYIVPGLIMMAVIGNAYANTVSSFYGAKFQRHIEEMQVAPMPDFLLLLGFVCGGVLRGLAVGAAVTAVAWCFAELRLNNLAIALSSLVLAATVFSLAGFINGIFAKSFDDISLIPTFIITPLTYLGGVFYSITLLPAFWREVSLANPILYMINAFRYGLLGVSDIGLGVSYAITCGFIVALATFALYLLRIGYGLRH
jgi:ABC-2 type transport system permease protein